MTKERDLQLIYEFGMMRNIPRVWGQWLGKSVANLAEHHYRVAWIALILAKHEDVKNIEKVLKMALVHDLPESRTGDVHIVSRLYTKRDEGSALSDILKDTIIEDEFISLWQEYERHDCIESQVVKDADTLDVDLELHELAGASSLEKRWHEMREKGVYPKLYTESAKRIWEMIYTSDPHDWHLLGKNRHNSGDWKQNN